jgi:hypothetical protein
MKPHRPKPSKRASDASARTYLRAHLGWLRGYPLRAESGPGQVAWMAFPHETSRAEVRELRVTRELLRSSTFALNRARRRFPRALPRVVGDVELWARGVERRLELLKRAVHEGEELPPLADLLHVAETNKGARRVIRAAARRRALRPVVDALFWIHWGESEALSEAARIVDAREAGLLTILEESGDLLLTLRCVGLAGEDYAQGVLGLVSDPRAWRVPVRAEHMTSRLCEALQGFRRRFEPPPELIQTGLPRPSPTLGPELARALSELPWRDPRARERVLALTSLLAEDVPLDAWETWWKRFDEAERDTRRLLSVRRVRQEHKERSRLLEGQLHAGLGVPASYSFSGRERLRAVAAAATPKVFAGLTRNMALVSGSRSRLVRGSNRSDRLRWTLLEAWAETIEAGAVAPGVLGRLLDAQHQLLVAVADLPERRRTWVCAELPSHLVESWVEDQTPLALLGPFLEVLLPWIQTGEAWSKTWGPCSDWTTWQALLESLRVTRDAEAARALVEAFPPVTSDLTFETWKVFLDLSGADPEKLRALARVWRPDRPAEVLARAVGVFRGTPADRALILQLLLDGHAKRVERLLALVNLLTTLDPQGARDLERGRQEQEDRPSIVREWDYPAPLHPELRDLEAASPRAAQIADQILSQDFPRPERLTRERDVIARRLAEGLCPRAEAPLAARLRSLEERLHAPRPVSPSRLARCREKLARRTRLCLLEAHEDLVHQRLQDLGQRLLGGPLPAAWLEDPVTLEVLGALGGLQPGFRALALRLLQVRMGPAPWDLREAPENRGFLARLPAGVDPTPWLEGIGPRPVTLPKGEPWTLDLEADPLQILRMGRPFGTCLAPGSFNFFSTVANAVDVNKRVLYARDAAGTIRGRCLITLTNEGCLVAFRVYGHEHHELIRAAVAGYVGELAVAMGTHVLATGRTPRLVAHDWYNDGPLALSEHGEPWDLASDLGGGLDAIAPRDLLARLQAAWSGRQLGVAYWSQLAESKALGDRPELVLPLVATFARQALTPATRLQVATLARLAGAREAARELLEPLLRRLPEECGTCCRHCFQTSLAAELVQVGLPHRALRLLRGRRRRRVDWSEEGQRRLLVAAKALQALHRPRKALALYRVASAQGSESARKHAQDLKRDLAG